MRNQPSDHHGNDQKGQDNPPTRANAYTQKSFERGLREHAVLFCHPVCDRGFAGVAFMYRKSAAWAVRSVAFLHKPCERFYADSRLMCVQLFRVDERRSVIVYVLYGKSGGRCEPEKKKYNAHLPEAVHEDSLRSGDVATNVCGDMNITMPGSVKLTMTNTQLDHSSANLPHYKEKIPPRLHLHGYHEGHASSYCVPYGRYKQNNMESETCWRVQTSHRLGAGVSPVWPSFWRFAASAARGEPLGESTRMGIFSGAAAAIFCKKAC